MNPPDEQLCGCGARLTTETRWTAHVKAGCTLAGMPRGRVEAADEGGEES